MATVLTEQLTLAAWIVNFVENLKKLGKEKITAPVLQARLELLENYWTKFLERHFQIVADPTLATTPYRKEDQYCHVEVAYIHAKAHLRTMLSDMTKSQSSIGPQAQNSTSGEPGLTSGIVSPLKPISLPTFSGSHLEWETFKEMFVSLVHNVDSLSPVLKLQYLLSAVEGDAAKRLKNIQVVAANYDIAWNILVKRYDNKRIRLSFHMRTLIECSSASSRSVDEILRILDCAEECIRAFRNLGCPVQHWDSWIVNLIVHKLDSATRQDWEESLGESDDFPSYTSLREFLETRVRAMEVAMHLGASTKPKQTASRTRGSTSSNVASAVDAEAPKCPTCSRSHHVASCSRFRQAALTRRREIVKKHQLCFNCMRPGHRLGECPSTNRCRKCDAKHHTLLHPQDRSTEGDNDTGSKSSGKDKDTQSRVGDAKEAQATTSLAATVSDSTLLATALVQIQSKGGNHITVRALLDTGSESSFITEHIAQLLRLKRTPADIHVEGIGGEVNAVAKSSVNIQIKSLQSTFSIYSSAIVLPRLTNLAPRRWVLRQSWDHLKGLSLADPHYDKPGRIDCILGMDAYARILRDGIRSGRPGEPVAQNTAFGWVLFGRVGEPSRDQERTTGLRLLATDATAEALSRFWEIEEAPRQHAPPEDERLCEQWFSSTTTRQPSGRYVVRLPFANAPKSFSGARDIATACLFRLERRLARDVVTSMAYQHFLQEYLDLGHMEAVPPEEVNQSSYYMPHHAVRKRDAPPEKIRVVFNASQADKAGVTLNGMLLAGPKLQQELWLTITRWRTFQFAFTADIVKMYRQIAVHPDDTNWQRVVWRPSPEQSIKDFRLTTVTYGTTCAPFLALRVLLQLANDEEHRFPDAAGILRRNMYVDDMLAGADTLEDAIARKEQLTDLCAAGGFQLSKWAANHIALAPSDPEKKSHPLPAVRSHQHDEMTSTLGLRWSTTDDTLSFNVRPRSSQTPATKRQLLSELAQLFDPLGWLAPITITAKLLLQTVWLRGHDWDSPLPQDLMEQWRTFRGSLHCIEEIKIPRWCKAPSTAEWTIHGFADASERAYAAAVYRVPAVPEDSSQPVLLMAKTKVAPVKVVSVARLELCGALLLARLMRALLQQLDPPPAAVYCWTDSTTVLAWLQGHPSKWTTFVANRVSEILTSLPSGQWRHIRGKENPADLATRGLPADKLSHANLWWEGPPWLASVQLPSSHGGQLPSTDQELRSKVTASSAHIQDEMEMLKKFSSLTKLLRVTAYVFRFCNNTRSPTKRSSGPLQNEEIHNSKVFWWRYVQHRHFPKERHDLLKGREVCRGSALRRLSPFLDHDGVIRVGGRLNNSFLPFAEKHPVILPPSSTLSMLIVRHAHMVTLHGGPQLTHSYIIRSYWILRARNFIKSFVRRCIICIRHSNASAAQQMAPLPDVRVAPSRPFSCTGLDYAGPILIRTTKGRGHKAYKGYIALFVCMSTRAVHLEAVTELSTTAFLAAFARFTSRRGLCSVVYSDNGTTFRGADAELKRMFHAASAFSQEAATKLANDGITWRFIPPRAPHFGGLWEAAVKSVKHHLRRVVGDSKLTFEELSTVLAKIEACLNSRPIAPISSDPMDLAALTPGHFLVGTALNAIPEPNSTTTSTSLQTRWHVVSQMRAHFWQRWRKEYLSQLQARTKWLSKQSPIRIGQLVIVKDDLLPPTKWLLGRVVQVHPGKDGIVRTVTIRTATSSSLQRPIVKLVPLELDDTSSVPVAPDTVSTLALSSR